MAFKRRLPETPIFLEHFQGGAGELEKYDILNGPDEMYQKGRVCSVMRLKPGCEIGRHRHNGDGEVFYILSGKGKYLLNEELVDIVAGDVLFCDDGEEHQVINDTDQDLCLLAVVLYSK